MQRESGSLIRSRLLMQSYLAIQFRMAVCARSNQAINGSINSTRDRVLQRKSTCARKQAMFKRQAAERSRLEGQLLVTVDRYRLVRFFEICEIAL
jgi:hypothetical protein